MVFFKASNAPVDPPQVEKVTATVKLHADHSAADGNRAVTLEVNRPAISPIVTVAAGKVVCMFIHGRPSGSNGTTDIYNQTTCKRMLHKIVSLLENSQHSQHSRPWRFVDQCLPASQITCRLGVPSAPVSGQHEQAYSPRVPAYAERTTFQCADKAVTQDSKTGKKLFLAKGLPNGLPISTICESTSKLHDGKVWTIHH